MISWNLVQISTDLMHYLVTICNIPVSSRCLRKMWSSVVSVSFLPLCRWPRYLHTWVSQNGTGHHIWISCVKLHLFVISLLASLTVTLIWKKIMLQTEICCIENFRAGIDHPHWNCTVTDLSSHSNYMSFFSALFLSQSWMIFLLWKYINLLE